MKPLLAFLKKRWLPLTCVVVVLAALPTAWYFSTGWNDGIIASAEEDAGDKLNRVRRAKVTYVIPSVVPGEEDTTIAQAPNPALTQWAAEQRAKRLEQVQAVIGDATRRNRGEHAPLVQGLYPEAPQNDAAAKRAMREYLNFMLGDPGRGEPSWYARTIESAGGGRTADQIAVAEALSEQKEREEAIAAAESENGRVGAERQAEINESLVSRRIGEYRRHAQGFSFYADESVIGGHDLLPPPSMDRREGAQVPGHAEGFVWMADAWVIEDVLSAVEKANTGVNGQPTEVELSPVKRIVQLNVEALPIFAPRGNDDRDRGSRDSGSSGSLIAREGLAPLDPSVSLTGRVSSPENQTYDVRRATVELIVSSEQLPAVIEAFHSTGNMTITDLDLEEIDVWEDLRKGYAYGTQHVFKASLELEIVWMRAWTVPLMPQAVQRALGVQNNG